MSTAIITTLLDKTANFSIEETLAFLANEYENKVVFSTSFGQEDQVITALIANNKLPITIFTLDTGRLFQETYDVFHKTVKKYKIDIKTYFPETGKYEFSNSGWWCSGFYPGTLLLLYQQTKDAVLYNEALRILGPLKKEESNTGTHDLGFMMYCSFGNANLIEPKQEYKSILLNSAKSLATRFSPTVGCIKSWDGKPDEYLVIIDNMMNLKLLFWATQVSGDSSFYKIAVTHANTTMQHHFRRLTRLKKQYARTTVRYFLIMG